MIRSGRPGPADAWGVDFPHTRVMKRPAPETMTFEQEKISARRRADRDRVGGAHQRHDSELPNVLGVACVADC
jgi:hypothetical protein